MGHENIRKKDEESTSGRTGLSRRSIWVLLTCCLLLAGSVRVFYLLEFRTEPDYAYPTLDPEYHDYWARCLVTGKWAPSWFLANDPAIQSHAYFRPPGYPYWLASIYRLFGTARVWPCVIQMALGIMNCFLAYVLGRKWFGPAVGLMLSFFMGIYWVFVFFEAELLPPVILVSLALVTIYSLGQLAEGPRLGWTVLSGLFSGLFALFRPNILLFVLVVPAWLAWAARREAWPRYRWILLAALYWGTCTLAIAPATVRNYRVTGELVLVSANSGVSLYVGNGPGATGTIAANEDDDLWNWNCFDYPRIVRNLEAKLGRHLNYAQASSYFSRRAMEHMSNHPFRTLALFAKRLVLLFGPKEVGNEKEDELVREHSRVLGCLPLSFPNVFSLALTGTAMFLWGNRGKRTRGARANAGSSGRRALRVGLAWLFVLVYVGSFVPFLVAGRYRVPIVPFLMLLGSYAVVEILGMVRRGRRMEALGWVLFLATASGLARVNWAGYEPKPENWHYQRAVAFTKAGKRQEALQEYRELLQRSPSSFVGRINTASQLAEMGRTAEAIDIMREMLAENRTPRILFELGYLLVEQGRPQEAIPLLEEGVRKAPGDSWGRTKLGAALVRTGRYEDAIQCFQEAQRGNPDFPAFEVMLGDALLRSGATNAAIAHFDRAISMSSDSVEVHLNVGIAFLATGGKELAASHFEHAIRIDPEDKVALHHLARLRLEARQWQEAVELLLRCVELDAGSALFHHDLAFAFARLGDKEEAQRHLRKAVTLPPEYPPALNALAWMIATDAEATDEAVSNAIALSERACVITGRRDAGLLDTLAVTYAAGGRHADAVTTAEQALQYAESDGRSNLVVQIRGRLEAFRAGERWIEK